MERKRAHPRDVVVPFAKPSPAQVAAAKNATIPDVLASGLRVLFCGINPSLYSAAVGHHFARPGNRFWPALHAGGFTPRLYAPWEDRTLAELRLGLTNLVARATAQAAELTESELAAGGAILRRKIRKHQPAVVAFLGISAYRAAFNLPKATLGRQPTDLAGAMVWVLPNPSGLNAHFQAEKLAELFGELRFAAAP